MSHTPSLTPESRRAILESLGATHFDVLVIGGGITGAGVARDAAARGLRVALVEAEDFAEGTSSRSSKLIHGGLRYLAMGEVNLVRETALERKAVHAMAPHLAEPCWMVVPAHNRAAMVKFRVGIGTYEKLGSVEEEDRHHTWHDAELAANEPLLRTGAYPWGVAYREYLTDDSRLVLAVLRAAVRDCAVVASRTRVIGLVRQGAGGPIRAVRVRCNTTQQEIEIAAEVIVNAAGPWVEQLARMEADPPRLRLHLSKGVHVVVDRSRLPVNNLVILSTADRRSIFAIPRGDIVSIGTTDTSYTGTNTLWPEVDATDVAYLLEPLGRFLDVRPLQFADVLATWAGVRPLIAEEGRTPAEMSRRDEVWTGPGGMLNVAGGKLTGFRRMAAEIVDAVGKALGRTLPAGPGLIPVPGGDIGRDLEGAARSLAAGAGTVADGRSVVDEMTARRLVRLYGSEAPDVLSLGAEPVVPGVPVVTGEVYWAIDVEAAMTLEDVVYRRTRIAWYLPLQRVALLHAIAPLVARRFGWSTEECARQVAAVHARYDEELAPIGTKPQPQSEAR